MIRHAVMVGLLLVVPLEASAGTRYPEKPIRIIVGSAVGSAVDGAARLIARKLAASLGAPVNVENLPGAAGNAAVERVIEAAPDGYTLALATNAQIIMNPSLYRLSSNPATALVPISQLAAFPNILVVPRGSPATTVQGLIAQAKAQPGMLSYGTDGPGGSPHMAGSLLSAMAGIRLRHVSYDGVVAALPDLFSGRVSMLFGPISAVLPATRDGRLRALAISSLRRSPALPGVATMADSGLPGFDATLWIGLLAPAATPSPVIALLYHESARTLLADEIQEKLDILGMEIVGSTPDEFAAVIESETSFWAKLIREADVTAQ